jgi:serine/threonine-protein kinase OSR1/STK39
VAIKVVDLEQFQDNSIEEIRKEISIMSTCFHKNVVACYVSFIEDSDLWLVMPVLGAGSCADIMKINCPGGIKNEAVIATIVSETLLGL